MTLFLSLFLCICLVTLSSISSCPPRSSKHLQSFHISLSPWRFFFFYLYTSLLSLFPSFALSLSLSFNFYSSCRSGYLDDPLLDIHVFLVEYTSSSFILSLQSIIIHFIHSSHICNTSRSFPLRWATSRISTCLRNLQILRGPGIVRSSCSRFYATCS